MTFFQHIRHKRWSYLRFRLQRRVARWLLPFSLRIRRVGAVLLLLVVLQGILLFVFHPKEAQAAWYTSGGSWQYRKLITIDHTKVSGNLTSFPVLISVTDTDLKTYAQADGDDILFTGYDGTTKLNHEIETYDSSTGQLVAWVQVPVLAAHTDTHIYLYYGNASVSSQQAVASTWDSSYKGVWHLKESGNGTAGEFVDSTGVNNGQGGGGTAANVPTQTTGKTGYGESFDNTNDYIKVADSVSLSPTTALTIEGWFNQPSATGTDAFVTKWNWQTQASWALQTQASDTLRFYYPTTLNEDGSVNFATSNAGTWTSGWHHVVAVFDGSQTGNSSRLKIYVDGVSVGLTYNAAVPSSLLDSTAEIRIGDFQNLSRFFNGTIDEVRFSNAPRSSEWIATEYTNQSSPSTFFSISGREQSPLVLNWNFDEGYGTSAHDSVAARTGTLTSTSGSSAAVKINDAANFGAMIGSGPRVVRTSGGTLYAFLNHAGSCEIWKSTNGSSWTEQDSANNPTCSSGGATSAAIDGNGTIHLAYVMSSNFSVGYDTFSTGTDTFGSSATALTGFGIYETAIAVDSNNKPHIIAADGDDWGGGANCASYIDYTNKVGAGWSTPVTVSSQLRTDFSSTCNDLFAVSITIDEDNLPEVAFADKILSDLDTGVGNVNNATAFSTTAPDTSVDLAAQMTDIGVDSSGNTYVSYIDGTTGYVSLAKRNDGSETSSWGTGWTASLNDSKTGTEPGLAITTTSVYLFYQNSLNDIAYDIYSGSWAGETTLETGTYSDVSVKWAYNSNNQGTTQIDYLFADLTDVYWNKLTLGGSGVSPTWQAPEACVSGSCLSFDGSTSFVSRTYASDTALDPSTGSMGVSAWIRHPSTQSGQDTILARYTTTGGYKLYMKSSGVICFGIDDDSSWGTNSSGSIDDEICSTTTYTDSRWHFIEASKNATSSITLYVDGVQVAQDTSIQASSSISGSSPTLYVGIDADGSSNAWTGYIDQVKLYNSARSADQVKADFTNKGSQGATAATLGARDQSTAFSQGLVGYWKMDESSWTQNCSTSSVSDSSGNANNGKSCPSTTGPTTTSAGKFGRAGSFDGTNDIVTVADSNSLDLTTAGTITAWIKRSSSTGNWQSVVAKGDQATDDAQNYFLEVDPNNLVIGAGLGQGNGTGVSAEAFSTTTINTGTWYHVVETWDKDKVYIYVNGKQENSATHSFTPAVNADTLSIGNFGGSANNTEPFSGSIDDVRIYNRTLTPGEIAALYDWAPGPVGYWDFNEKTGTSAHDKSGNANTGTLTGGPLWSSGKYGGGITFDGSDDNIDLGTDSSIGPSTSFTSEAWIYQDPSASGVNTIFASGSNDLFNWSMDISATGKLDIRLDNNTSFPSTTTITKGVWHYVAVSKDGDSGTNASIYIDGKLDTTAAVGSLTASTGVKAIGWRPEIPGEAFKGVLDEVRVYNYARTPKQIVSDMNAGHPNVGSPVGSPLGYWKFDDGYATTAHNSGSDGSNANGTLTNMATASTASGWTTAGKIGKAVSFDGSNDYVSIGNPTSAQITGDLSLSAWVRLSANANQDIIAKRGAVNQWGYRLWVDSTGTPKFDVSRDGSQMATASANTTLSPNTWYHLVGTYAASNALTIYINGMQKGQNTSSIYASIKNSTANLLFGAENAGATNNFKGSIDEAKLYDYALNADEVNVEYNQGKSQVMGALTVDANNVASNSADRAYCPPGNAETNCAAGLSAAPIGEWNFDERTGTIANDSSGNNNSATITAGNGGWVAGKIGGAYNFDGTTTLVDAGNATPLNDMPNNGGFSVSAWIYPRSTGQNSGGRIVVKDSTGPTNGWQLSIGSSSKLTFDANFATTNLSTSTTTTLTMNRWQNVQVTWTGSTARSSVHMYVNGIEQAQSGGADGAGAYVTDAGKNLVFGNSQTATRTWDGFIDHVRLYNYIRTPAQVTWDFNRGGPIGYWKLDECSGSTIHDASGNSKDGTWTGSGGGSITSAGTCASGSSTEAWGSGATGKFNSSMAFDGTDDVVSMGDVSPYEFDRTNPFSLSIWFKTTNNAGQTLIAKMDHDASDKGYELQTGASSFLYFQIINTYSTNGIEISAPYAYADGNWHHLVGTYDGSSSASGAKLYVDGKQVSTTTSFNNLSATIVTTAPLQLGKRTGSSVTQPYSGQLDEAQVFSYALSDAQVRNLYNQSAALRFGPLSGNP